MATENMNSVTPPPQVVDVNDVYDSPRTECYILQYVRCPKCGAQGNCAELGAQDGGICHCPNCDCDWSWQDGMVINSGLTKPQADQTERAAMELEWQAWANSVEPGKFPESEYAGFVRMNLPASRKFYAGWKARAAWRGSENGIDDPFLKALHGDDPAPETKPSSEFDPVSQPFSYMQQKITVLETEIHDLQKVIKSLANSNDKNIKARLRAERELGDSAGRENK